MKLIETLCICFGIRNVFENQSMIIKIARTSNKAIKNIQTKKGRMINKCM